MGVVYYKYKSAKEIYSMPVPHAFISVSELKQHILMSDRHGRGRTRGHGPREDIAISNAQTGEEYGESAMVPQNTTVLVHRTSGQLSEKITLTSSRKVTEGCSVPSSKSVVTDSSCKSGSSAEVQDEDAAIKAVIDAAELKLEEQPGKRGQASGRFLSGRCYGHGPLEGETPPLGYVCRTCGVPGHFIQHCPQESKTPPPGYICYRCRIPGHFIHHCPNIGDPDFDKNKRSRSLAPVVNVCPVDGILEALVPAASVNAVDDLPAELHCRLCKKVMIDAVLTSKCCFDSFCDKCIRDYIITQSKCICGVVALADDLIPNQTLRSTISNMLATKASSGTTKHRSSSGSNPDPKLQNHTPSAASEREMKQSTDQHLSAASAPDDGLQVAAEGELVNQPLEKLAANVDPLSKDEGSSVELSVEKAVASAEILKPKDGSGSTSKVITVSGALEHNATRTDQPKKKRKKAGSTKIVHPNNVDYGYNVPFDPAYYNPFVSGYPWVNEPYMYGSMGMPYGVYPMGPNGVNSINSMPPQALAMQGYPANPPQALAMQGYPANPPQALVMQGYPANYHRHETQPTLHRDTEAGARRSRQTERPKDTGLQPQLSERDRQRGSSHGSGSRNRRSSLERRDHGRSDGAFDDCHEDHSSRKRMHVSSRIEGDKQSSRRSRHSSKSLTCEDSGDDERNFKRTWGHRSSVAVDTRR
ncbi:E3 ubiquitin ligase PQT3-like [Phragmites australis]|uniref:E3 ubiquitin ligase PQT3-like n=1 Tax=Phragmites australis TaxID=29695 RepID=UPI002D76531F|nr:E3 ubiquitin ligase PQT3-like [Phragmites australis]